MPQFGKDSAIQLSTCHQALQEVFHRVVQFHDCKILEGHRDKVKQNEYFKRGASKKQYPAGKHNTYPSLALDAAPFPIPGKWGEIDWKQRSTVVDSWLERVKFYQLASVVHFVAARMGVVIRWGGDWDGDGDYKDQTFDDLVHFELVGEQYEKDVKIL